MYIVYYVCMYDNAVHSAEYIVMLFKGLLKHHIRPNRELYCS